MRYIVIIQTITQPNKLTSMLFNFVNGASRRSGIEKFRDSESMIY